MTGHLRVLHVCATYFPALAYGGPIVSTHALVRAQQRLGANVRVLTTDANGGLRLPAGDRDVDGIPVRYASAMAGNRYGLSLGLFASLAREVRARDVIHVHGTNLPSTTVGLWAAAWTGRPTVLSPRGSLMAWARGRKRLRKTLYGILDAIPLRRTVIHATSEMEARDARSLGFERVVVVPNGVDTAELRREVSLDVRRELGLASNAVIIAWLGRFDPVKNLEALLTAMKGVDATLVLAGAADNPYARELRARASSFGSADVRFVGPVEGERKVALLQQANVYVHPSHMESYGMSIVEALAAGCPVVASTGTPWRELEEAGAGRWVAPDPGALSSGIADLLSRDRSVMGDRARALAERHCWEERARCLLDAYDDARRLVARPT